ncbi:hypothetical protein NQ314_021212 [Rhamnusium bicolor]|uniref:Uncharacterized protein n=1 Tax=Rhamnusium bicolor TaxID=1586634 RepID=A0AAV8WI88_9CUCU|nr:hypothetical protein NQ314_021212 [Rhamnusium bicolor]
MNPLVIPPSPNWFETSILACAPDNTLIIICVTINKSWGQPNKLLVTAAADRIIKCWNVETMEKKCSHMEHINHNRGPVVGAAFAGDDRVISASEDGGVVVWNIKSNQTVYLKYLFSFKVTITCISTCPHSTWLAAFGLKNGLVLVTDLRRVMISLYYLYHGVQYQLMFFQKKPYNCVGTDKVSMSITDEFDEDNQEVAECNKNVISENICESKTTACQQSKDTDSTSLILTDSKDTNNKLVKNDNVNVSTSKPELVKSDNIDASISKPELVKSDNIDVSTSKPELVKSDNIDASISKPELVESDNIDVSTSKPELVKNDIIDASISKPELVESDNIDVSTSEPELVKSDNIDASISKPELVKSDNIDASISKPELVESDNIGVSTSKPELVKSDYIDASISKPELVESDNIDVSTSKPKYNKKNLWTDLKHADDDDLPQDFIEKDRIHPLLKMYDSGDDDFLKECQRLKNKILGTVPQDTSSSGVIAEEKLDRPVLKAEEGHNEYNTCQNKQKPELKLKSEEATDAKYLDEAGSASINDVNDDQALGLNVTDDEKCVAASDTITSENVEPINCTAKLSLAEFINHKSNIKEVSSTEGPVTPTLSGYVIINTESIEGIPSTEANGETSISDVKIPLSAKTVSIEKSDNTEDKSITKDVFSAEDDEVLTVEIKTEAIKTSCNDIEDEGSIKKISPTEDNDEVSSSDKSIIEEVEDNVDLPFGGSCDDIEDEGSIKKISPTEDSEEVSSNDIKEIPLIDLKMSPEKMSKIVGDKNIIEEVEDIVDLPFDGSCDDIEDEGSIKKISPTEDSEEVSSNDIKEIPLIDSKMSPEKMSKIVGDKRCIEEVEDNVDLPLGVKSELPLIPSSGSTENESSSMEDRIALQVVPLIQHKENVPSWKITPTILPTSNSNGTEDKSMNLPTREITRDTVGREEKPRKEFLLASSSIDGNIYIWRAGTDGRMQTFLSVPNKSNHRKSRSNADRMRIVLCWVTPTMLLSSSKSAELIQWYLPKPIKEKQYRIIHNDHSPLLFSIAAPIILLNEANWLNEKKLNAWTVGQDRMLLSTSLEKERTNLACYPTLGRAECFALSPLDPNRIQGKVVTLAWHPTNELILAFGTSEGRIGCLDTNKLKAPKILPDFFKSLVHKIEWGPMFGNKEDIGLFAVAEGKLVMFRTSVDFIEPQEVDTPDSNNYVYTFAWKQDYSILLVGTKTGAIITYSTDLQILSTQYLQHKVQYIYWHPESTQSDVNVSKYCRWFAAVCNFKDLIVFDLEIKSDNYETKIVAKYEGRGEMINCAAWSPYVAGDLVVARDDGIAEVWNVESEKVLSTFVDTNFEGLLTVIWSPLDPDFIISSGKDHTTRIWRISDFPGRDERESGFGFKFKEESHEKKSECNSSLPKVEKAPEELVKPKKSNKSNNIFPNLYPPTDPSDIVCDLRKLLEWKESLNSTEKGDGDHGPNILSLFGNSDRVLKLMDLNACIHKQRGKHKLNSILSLIKGDISATIKEAIEERRVTPWIITMAPMVSPKLWQLACDVYAQQLAVEPDSDPLEVATFFLMCHKVEDAIHILCDGGLYREALALAKCRLPASDGAIKNIIEKWLKHAMTVGNFEVAAQCNIFLGKYESAASALFRRSDTEILNFAAELAEKSGNEDLHKAILLRYNVFKSEASEKLVELPSRSEAILKYEQITTNDENGSSALQETHRNEEVQVESNTEGNGMEQDNDTVGNKNTMKECEKALEAEDEPLNEKSEVAKEENLLSAELNGNISDDIKELSENVEEYKVPREKSSGATIVISVGSTSKSSEDICSNGTIVTEEKSEISEKENCGLLSTEDVETLLSSPKFELSSSETESIDFNKNSGDKC